MAKKKTARRTIAPKKFDGISNSGKFQEALDDALSKLDQAIADTGIADGMGRWQLKSVTGDRGGIAGFRNVKVTIRAKLPK